MGSVHPALPMLLGSLLLPFLGPRLRKPLLVALPLLGLVNLALHPFVEGGSVDVFVTFAGIELHVLRYDALARLFAVLFHVAALVGAIYVLHVKDRWQHVTGIAYAGSAVGTVLAGDLFTLFLCWELLAVTSVFQIWARGTTESRHSGIRYLLAHVLSGLLLLLGAAFFFREHGHFAFDAMTLDSTATWLIFLAFGIKVGFPVAHTWIVDAYPASTSTAPLFLSAFSTKASVYCLARGFAGTELLIFIGASMCIFPIFYAVIENDLRRVLSYSMINQIGFMVVGIGIGTSLAINGAVGHVFAHVIYKGLLFMSMGAVHYRLGTTKGTELGGLYKTMPWTTLFCIIGAASISAVPLFSAFITKSMILVAAAEQDLTWVWLVLLFASAGVLEHAGIKVPYFAFFAHDSGKRPKEAPLNMRVAMGISSVICIAIGVFPALIYALLPSEPLLADGTHYHAWSLTHVVTQLQLLVFAALGVFGLMLLRKYPAEVPAVNVDADVLWRKGVVGLWRRLLGPLFQALSDAKERALAWLPRQAVTVFGERIPRMALFQEWAAGSIVALVTVFLAAYLALQFFT